MRNWTIKDAVATIQNGKDTEAIKEIAKHFPVFFMAVAKNDLGALAAMMTEKMTVRRLAEVDDAEATDADEETEANSEETAVEAEDVETEGDEDLNSMSTKQLIAVCTKRGIKVPKYGKNKAFYLAALQGGSAEADDADGEAEETETESDPYAGKNALQLYSICKQRGLKMEPRQKASVYLEALKKADAKAAKADEAADEDGGDWNDEEEEAPKKSAKKEKAEKKSTKKSTKKAEPEEDEDTGSSADDDDDWEI